MHYNLITILGPTAVGKTRTSAYLAADIDGEVISADSRQVYREMTIGTGKDLEDYIVNGKTIPYHLIDICEVGYEYNLFEFQQDFFKAFNTINSRNKTPILCGGTGLYIAAATNPQNYLLSEVPPNPSLRKELEQKSFDELKAIFLKYRQPHNKTDFDTKKRLIRAIEIVSAGKNATVPTPPPIHSLFIGINIDINARRRRITQRLKKRLENGMIDEVKHLFAKIPPEKLIYYGLEYKYITLYLIGKLSYDEMFCQLEIAIHQFAKRQMTWFRGMERKGIKIHWMDAFMPEEKKVEKIKQLYQNYP